MYRCAYSAESFHGAESVSVMSGDSSLRSSFLSYSCCTPSGNLCVISGYAFLSSIDLHYLCIRQASTW